MFLVKMGEEGRAAERLALQPREAPGVQQGCFGERVERLHELLKDSARLTQYI